MREISINEMKKIEIEILKYIDDICRKNDIKYSATGGTLIGAVRHNGFIPWDDDIDIVMTYENFLKFENIVKNDKNSDYRLLNNKTDDDCFFVFSKMIRKGTYVKENNNKRPENYGVFVDIFTYNYVPGNKKKKIYEIVKNYCINVKYYGFEKIIEDCKWKKILKYIKKYIIQIIGYKYLNERITKLFNKYNDSKCEYMISNWPSYAYEKEIQKASNFTEYIDKEFEDMKIMIIKNYDEVLKTTFGDYMKLPPQNERCAKHGIKAYWRE